MVLRRPGGGADGQEFNRLARVIEYLVHFARLDQADLTWFELVRLIIYSKME